MGNDTTSLEDDDEGVVVPPPPLLFVFWCVLPSLPPPLTVPFFVSSGTLAADALADDAVESLDEPPLIIIGDFSILGDGACELIDCTLGFLKTGGTNT